MLYKAKMPEAWARMEWCRSRFGRESCLRWWRNKGYLCFVNEQDYLMYLLRWA